MLYRVIGYVFFLPYFLVEKIYKNKMVSHRCLVKHVSNKKSDSCYEENVGKKKQGSGSVQKVTIYSFFF